MRCFRIASNSLHIFTYVSLTLFIHASSVAPPRSHVYPIRQQFDSRLDCRFASHGCVAAGSRASRVASTRGEPRIHSGSRSFPGQRIRRQIPSGSSGPYRAGNPLVRQLRRDFRYADSSRLGRWRGFGSQSSSVSCVSTRDDDFPPIARLGHVGAFGRQLRSSSGFVHATGRM